MQTPPIVSADEWHAARAELLVKEKEVMRARDALAAERRRMPWLAVEQQYRFDTANGEQRLVDLFDGRTQLIVYRAFLEPGVHGWPDHACVGCSMVADQVAHPAHLHMRDTSLVFASRARITSFSFMRRSARAALHSSADTIGGVFMSVVLSGVEVKTRGGRGRPRCRAGGRDRSRRTRAGCAGSGPSRACTCRCTRARR
jgi:predicted dithiol-disulfide oxidoreductase (DUF899 family)